jgi:hypothetical protein
LIEKSSISANPTDNCCSKRWKIFQCSSFFPQSFFTRLSLNGNWDLRKKKDFPDAFHSRYSMNYWKGRNLDRYLSVCLTVFKVYLVCKSHQIRTHTVLNFLKYSNKKAPNFLSLHYKYLFLIIESQKRRTKKRISLL